MGNAPFSLKGRVALVTGASRGLGLAMAQALGEAGAFVIVNGRDPASLDAAVARLTAAGVAAAAVAFDVTDAQARRAGVAQAAALRGRLDILVGNAGVQHRAPLAAWTEADFDRVVESNMTACFFLAQLCAPHMKAGGYGRVIFTTSVNALLGRETIHAYVASKHGLLGLTRSLSTELGRDGITCNAIAPGYFMTEMNEALRADGSFVEKIAARTALGRWGEPAELGGACVYLASEAAGYVTGQQIVVDGGMTSAICL
ncbi:MAG: SDR family oxidoreductase [Rhodoblastus sp.]|nr:MAG: SDR family oxidoreductase [Rhodoblastus sp.]